MISWLPTLKNKNMIILLNNTHHNHCVGSSFEIISDTTGCAKEKERNILSTLIKFSLVSFRLAYTLVNSSWGRAHSSNWQVCECAHKNGISGSAVISYTRVSCTNRLQKMRAVWSRARHFGTNSGKLNGQVSQTHMVGNCHLRAIN